MPDLFTGLSRRHEQPAVKPAQGKRPFAILAQQAAGAVLDGMQDVCVGKEAGGRIVARALKMGHQAALPGMRFDVEIRAVQQGPAALGLATGGPVG